MKKLIICLILISFSANALSGPVVFPHPLSDIHSISKESLFYPEHYLQTRPLPHNESELLNYFEKAQAYYAVQSFDLAKIYYTKVANLQFVDDWREAHRKAIALSLSRLSELYTPQKEFWAQKAASFTPDTSGIEWDVRDWKKDFDLILMNGHQVDLNRISKVKIPYGEYRIVFLSKMYMPQILQVTSQQIPFLQPIKIPFVSGTCKRPALANPEIKDATIIYPDCKKALRNFEWEKENATATNLQPQFVSTFKEPSKPFYKQTWFAIAATVVVAGLIYYAVEKQKGESSAPSSTVIGEF